MTLAEVESLLASRGLRIRRVLRRGESRRWEVTVADEATGAAWDATGVDLRGAIEAAIEAAKKRTVVNRRALRFES